MEISKVHWHNISIYLGPYSLLLLRFSFPANIYLFKLNNRNNHSPLSPQESYLMM